MANVLIAEPDDGICQLLEIVVRMRGDEPVLFEEGADLEALDAVVIDCSLTPAFAAVRELRVGRPELPVICTGSRSEDPEALSLGFVAYLLQPFSLAEIHAGLAAALPG